MANVTPETDSATTERHPRWLFALVTTSLVTVAGLVAAVQQFVVKFLGDQSAHTRTLWGLLYMLLGVVGVCLPVLLLRYKKRFLSLGPSRQWVVSLGIPTVYVLAFAFCMDASTRSTTLIVPRRTPTAVVHFEPTKMRVIVVFRDGWTGQELEYGSNRADLRRGDQRFSAALYQGFMRRIPRRETVSISGRVKQLGNGTIQMTLDVDAREPVRLAVENLENVQVRRDGERIGESTSQSGTFQLTITGRSSKDT